MNIQIPDSITMVTAIKNDPMGARSDFPGWCQDKEYPKKQKSPALLCNHLVQAYLP